MSTDTVCKISLDERINQLYSSEKIDEIAVLKGVEGLSYKDQIVYAGNILRDIVKGSLDSKFRGNANKGDVLETLEVIQICAASELESMAYRDELTGLPNRRKLSETVFAKNESNAVLMFDIDKFKSWNDVYGHNIGDVALKVIGYVLNDTIREGIAGRYGGEEFYAVLKEITQEGAKEVAERVRQNLETKGMNYLYKFLENEGAQLKRDGNEYACMLSNKIKQLKEDNPKITVSVGISMGLDNMDLEATKNQADVALYHAKNNGRNRVVAYEPGMTMPVK